MRLRNGFPLELRHSLTNIDTKNANSVTFAAGRGLRKFHESHVLKLPCKGCLTLLRRIFIVCLVKVA